MMKRYFIFIAVLIFCMSTMAAEPDLKPLFDGKSFDGWQEPDNNIWWKINNGVLAAKSDPEQKGSVLWTSNEYTDFLLQLDFRFGPGTIDSGVFVRVESEQIQIGESGSLKRDLTCAPYISGKGYPVEGVGVAALLKTKDWNTMSVKAVGNVYTITLNGKQVLEYPSLTAVEKGPLGLQLHANRDMQIEFRNIKIAELN